MLKQVAIALAASTLVAGLAQAADLPRRNAPAPYIAPAPLFTWTGFYVGANAGYAFGNDAKTTTVGTPAFVALGPNFVPGSLNTKANGFIGGGQVGYNYQYGNLVYGIEADIDYVDQKKSASFTGPGFILGSQLRTSAKTELDYLGTVRARIGFVPMDRWMIYATGGLAYADVKTSGSVVAIAAPGIAWAGSKSDVKAGFAVGGGAEYAFTNNLTVKAEYLYYDLGNRTTNAIGNANVRAIAALNGVDYISRTKTNGSIVRAGINYKF